MQIFHEIGIFSLLIVIQIFGFYLAKDNALKIMAIFSLLGVIAMLVGIFGSSNGKKWLMI